MKFVFVHQNFPGQFGRMAAALIKEGHEVVGIGTLKQCSVPGVKYFSYVPVDGPDDEPYQHRYSPVVPRLRRAYGAAHCARQLAEQGFRPDVVAVNTGWGENLFLKDVWPNARHVAYFEYYYAAKGQDLDFDPEYPVENVETVWRLRAKNAMQLGAFDAADLVRRARPSTSATRFRIYLRDRIAVIHDGIDAQRLKPDPSVTIRIGKDGPASQPGYSGGHLCDPQHRAHARLPHHAAQPAGHPRYRPEAPGRHRRGQGQELFGQCAGRPDLVRRLPREDRPARRLVPRPHGGASSLRAIRQGAAALLRPCLPDLPVRAVLVADRIHGARMPDRGVRHRAGAGGHRGRRQRAACSRFSTPRRWPRRVRETLENKEQSAAMAKAARALALQKYDFETICLPQWRRFLGVR